MHWTSWLGVDLRPVLAGFAQYAAVAAASRLLLSGPAVRLPAMAIAGFARNIDLRCRCGGMVGGYQDRQRAARQARIRRYRG